MLASGQCKAETIALATAIDLVKSPPMFPPLTELSSAASIWMIQSPDCAPSEPVVSAARSPTPLIVTAVTPSDPSVPNSFVQAAALPALGVTVTVIGTFGPAYMHIFPPKPGVAAVNVTPTTDDAWAAVSSEHTLTVDDAPSLAAPVAALAVRLAATEGDGADVLCAAAGVLDPFEHAVAEMVTSTRLAAVNTMGNRMTSPSFRRSTVGRATAGDQGAVTST